MPSPSNSAVYYLPGPVPTSLPPEAQRFLHDELERIRGCIALLAAGHIETSYAAPPKPREGDFRLADGVKWDPVTAGAPRFVGYRGGAWVELG